MKIDRKKFFGWLKGDGNLLMFIEDMTEEPDIPREQTKKRKHAIDRMLDEKTVKMPRILRILSFRSLYSAIAIVCCAAIIIILLATVSNLPRYGEEHAVATEVTDRYIESGVEETGAVNTVAGIILDYRAFDTLGESFVLFCALNCVLILLRRDDKDEYGDTAYYSLANDNILRKTFLFLIPIVFVFGIYVMLNGHLSPGGGFSGGAVLGAGIILLSAAYGGEASGRFITEKRFKTVCFVALSFYCLAKSYSFFTGANGMENIIGHGTPGNILSSGLILPLNIAVGMVVACTMYGFYRMFKKGVF